MKSPIVAPSLLSADFVNLASEIHMINESKADWFHLDIMDGVFVPNISFGFGVIEAIKYIAEKPLDVHLMIVNPDRYLEDFQRAGADMLSVHVEACVHVHRTIGRIKELGMKVGVAINPGTPLDALDEILEDIDMVCLMTVNPGFGGQQFRNRSLTKINMLKQMIHDKGVNVLIEVDGGVSLDNATAIFRAGGDALVAGNAIFSSNDPEDVIEKLKNITRLTQV